MLDTMKGLAQGITQGIPLLAHALTRQPQQMYPSQYQQSFSYQQQHGAYQQYNYPSQNMSTQSAAASYANGENDFDNTSGSAIYHQM